ncbi:hypothetical protein Fmac_017885 [Flemingia macrophylla]|uniref:Uncharacterized protein n=1 Tax=Flemingia macrophylla TaxID=520843 RepID=A0ABD1M3D3_9FABA
MRPFLEGFLRAGPEEALENHLASGRILDVQAFGLKQWIVLLGPIHLVQLAHLLFPFPFWFLWACAYIAHGVSPAMLKVRGFVEFKLHFLGVLATYCAAQPLLRLLTGNSAFYLNGKTGLAPFEITALIIEALTWSSMIALILFETKVLFGTYFLFIPNLAPYSGHITMQAELADHGEYEPLYGEDQVCPERHTNAFSSE